MTAKVTGDVIATTPRDRTKTKQDYRTPQDLRRAVERRFGMISIDLAASDGDEIVPLVKHFTPEEDSLKQNWLEAIVATVAWLNPPFKDIARFSSKCVEWRREARVREAGISPAVICMLVPASVDSIWWNQNVRGNAIAYALAPRITFAGETEPYPKPCALCVYDPRHEATNELHNWRWKP